MTHDGAHNGAVRLPAPLILLGKQRNLNRRRSLLRALAGSGAIAPRKAVSYIDTMTPVRRHGTLVERIFQDPPPADVRWTEVQSLLSALGAEISEGRGSRVRVFLNGVRAVFHRPHPRPTMDRGAVRSLRRFFREAGVSPEE